MQRPHLHPRFLVPRADLGADRRRLGSHLLPELKKLRLDPVEPLGDIGKCIHLSLQAIYAYGKGLLWHRGLR